MFYHRGFCYDVEALQFKVVALFALFCISTFGPCTMTGMQNPLGHDEYGSYRNDLSSGSQDVLVGDSRRTMAPQTSIPKLSLENVCRRSDLFCFPSTLSGFFSDFHSAEANVSGISGINPDEALLVESMQTTNDLNWSSNHGNFQLLSGSVVSCSLELKEGVDDASFCRIDGGDQKDVPSCRGSSLDSETSGFNQKEESVRMKSSHADDFSSLHVQISHSLLDWGQKYLHFPSLAFLTMENRHNQSVLKVYEPYSTNAQFYPCNYSEITLGPGEGASICFVFLPKWLGLSSAHLILQTSSGGFLIQARGLAVESPYVIRPSVGLKYSSGGRWSNISLFNPSNKVLHVKEVSAWISFSSGNISYSTKAVCSVVDHEGSSDFTIKKWLDVKISQVGQPVMAMRPLKTWAVGSNRNEPILELELPYHSQANIFGSLCVRLTSASKDDLDTIILQAEFGGGSVADDVKSPISVSVKVLVPCEANGTTIVSLLLENGGPDLLTIVKISAVGENTESFQTKYIKGLILFPRTVTQVAMVAYTPNPHMNLNCKLLVQTNKSDAPELEISCSDVANLCLQSHSYAEFGHRYGVLNYDNAGTRSANAHQQSTLEIKATEMTKADESVLGNWRSQGTENGVSVLDDDEVLFPLVHVGTHQSKWISVVNPSSLPIVMQLLLNSGEIINRCQGSDEISQPFSSYNLVLNGYMTPSRYGFSIAGNALTEAYVHPHGKAVLGPIVFHPSSRCTWRSSALVRNNLTGVEWLSLLGSGGSHSLLLLDGSDPVHTIEFRHNLPSTLNCGSGQPSMKVLFAKNAGDLPLEVERISVSGTKCELDGFVVRTCKGFALQPGESRKLVISYRMDFRAALVRRELELVMSGGILVVPMQVSLPTSMFTMCKRSLLWARFKKFFLAVLVSSLLISIACSCMFSFIIRGENLPKTSSGHEDYSSSMHCSHGRSSDVCAEPETVQVQASPLPAPAKEVAKSSSSSPSPSPSPSSSSSSPSSSSPSSSSSSSSSSLLSKSMAVEASKPVNLIVKTGKEKGRRRKKRRSGAGLMGQLEATSSNSSNSTPSSPLSPISSSTPKRSPELSPNQHIRTKSPFKYGSTSKVSPAKDKTSAPVKTITPRARAPGAEREAFKAEDGSGSVVKLKYDIWDDHLGLCFPGPTKVASIVPTIAEDSNFGSFFAMSPQEFFTTSQAETVSSKQDGQ